MAFLLVFPPIWSSDRERANRDAFGNPTILRGAMPRSWEAPELRQRQSTHQPDTSNNPTLPALTLPLPSLPRPLSPQITGGGIMNSLVVQGLVLRRDTEGSVKSLKGAKVAVYGCAIDTAGTETKGTVLVRNVRSCVRGEGRKRST